MEFCENMVGAEDRFVGNPNIVESVNRMTGLTHHVGAGDTL